MQQYQTTLKISVKSDEETLNIKVEDALETAPDFCRDVITVLIMVCARLAERSFTTLQKHYHCEQSYECEVELTLTEKDKESFHLEVSSESEIGAFFRNGIMRFMGQDVEFLAMLGLA